MFAIMASGATGAISKNIKIQKLLDRVVGATFVALGIRLALTRH